MGPMALKREVISAYLLIPVTLLAIVLGSTTSNGYLNRNNLIGLVTDYLLGFFFLNVGLELKFELSEGVLVNRKLLVISLFSAVIGMVVPAAIYVFLCRANGISHSGWGITMATDLPLVLVVLSIFKQNRIRGFILALATFDDIGSVIVLSILYHQNFHGIYFLSFLAVLVLYFVLSRFLTNIVLGAFLFILALYFGRHSGVQSSLIGVAFGIMTSVRVANRESINARMRKFIEPFTAFIVVPLFIFVSLDRNFHFTLQLLSSAILVSLVLARLIGKPLGIFFGALVAKTILKVQLPFNYFELLLVGALATLGLSVSLLFAEKDFSGTNQTLAVLAILVIIPLGILLSFVVRVAEKKSAI
ncbi:MAG: Na+/H+ antiporter NhaA [Actinomycetes bacterium]